MSVREIETTITGPGRLRVAFHLHVGNAAISLVTRWTGEPRAGRSPVETAGVHLHHPQKLHDWWSESEHCDVLAGGRCWRDGGYLVADEVWAAFFVDEELGWKELRAVFDEWTQPKDGES